jgi:heterotetrameric sarcosine oxidase delta subunit
MIQIPCPHCGPRAQVEFSYGGDATVTRPDPATTGAGEWLDRLYLRDNPRGPHLEWWQHTGGCRAWIKVRRDTATHAVDGAWAAGEEPAP